MICGLALVLGLAFGLVTFGLGLLLGAFSRDEALGDARRAARHPEDRR